MALQINIIAELRWLFVIDPLLVLRKKALNYKQNKRFKSPSVSATTPKILLQTVPLQQRKSIHLMIFLQIHFSKHYYDFYKLGSLSVHPEVCNCHLLLFCFFIYISLHCTSVQPANLNVDINSRNLLYLKYDGVH